MKGGCMRILIFLLLMLLMIGCKLDTGYYAEPDTLIPRVNSVENTGDRFRDDVNIRLASQNK
jgi:hypothetical protein